MTEIPSREERISALQLEFETSYNGNGNETTLARATMDAQLRYSLPFVMVTQEGLIHNPLIIQNARVPSTQYEYATFYGPHYQMPWLNGKSVLEIGGGE